MLQKCGYGHYVVSVTKILWQSKNFVLKTNILNCSSYLFSFYCVIPELTFRQLLDDMNSGKTTLKNLHDLQVYKFLGWKWSLIHSKFTSNKEMLRYSFFLKTEVLPSFYAKKDYISSSIHFLGQNYGSAYSEEHSVFCSVRNQIQHLLNHKFC